MAINHLYCYRIEMRRSNMRLVSVHTDGVRPCPPHTFTFCTWAIKEPSDLKRAQSAIETLYPTHLRGIANALRINTIIPSRCKHSCMHNIYTHILMMCAMNSLDVFLKNCQQNANSPGCESFLTTFTLFWSWNLLWTRKYTPIPKKKKKIVEISKPIWLQICAVVHGGTFSPNLNTVRRYFSFVLLVPHTFHNK